MTAVQQNELNDTAIQALGVMVEDLGKELDQARLHKCLAQLDPDEDPWRALELYDPEIKVSETGDYGSWPTQLISVIKFQYQDQERPYIEVDGERHANIVDHYCVVADAGDRQIIDSADDTMKNGNMYGNPVSWASFSLAELTVADVEPEQPVVADAADLDPTRQYRVLGGGESGWNIARKLNVDAQVLKEHNDEDFEDFGHIPGGTLLHLPTRLPDPAPKRLTRFEFLTDPLEMHVAKDGGTRKYTFGNIKSGLRETGPRSRQNKNLLIYCLAHVPVGADDTEIFYMESNDLDVGHGKVRWTVGFRQEDLADGHVEDPTPEEFKPSVEVQAQLDEAEQNMQVLEDKVPAAELLAADPEPTSWQDTYKPLNDAGTPEVFLFNRDMIVHDYENEHPNKMLRRYDGVRIAGTFTGPDGVECYRPKDAADNFAWYGIPIVDPETGEPNLVLESELFNINLSLAERSSIRHGRLTVVERYFTVPLAKATARSPFLRRYADKVKTKE